MAAKFSFQLASPEARRSLPGKIIVGQRDQETSARVLLKLLAYLLFYRERLQLEPRLQDEEFPWQPDLVQFDYTLRVALWVECGDCPVSKLDRLAVKLPEAELWVMRRSWTEAEELLQLLARHQLRRHRYHVLGLDPEMFAELQTLLQARNTVFWVCGSFDPPRMQFEFNGLWFDAEFQVGHH